jgi:uncharacterized protein (TIGR04255 family)
MNTGADRPDFDRPPVEQVLLAVVFRPLTRLRASHLGLFWERINRSGDFPSVDEFKIRRHYLEEFGPENQQQGFEVSVVDRPPVPRVVFSSADGRNRVDVQDDLLQVGWYRSGDEPYPHFEQPRDEFVRILDIFRSFLKDYRLGAVRVRQAELSYINRLPTDALWANPIDLQRVVRFQGPVWEGMPKVEDLHFAQRHVLLTEGRPWARLYAGLDADHTSKGTQGARLSFTVRGPVRGDDVDVISFLEQGHDAIVAAFVELTTEHAHSVWGRRH